MITCRWWLRRNDAKRLLWRRKKLGKWRLIGSAWSDRLWSNEKRPRRFKRQLLLRPWKHSKHCGLQMQFGVLDRSYGTHWTPLRRALIPSDLWRWHHSVGSCLLYVRTTNATNAHESGPRNMFVRCSISFLRRFYHPGFIMATISFSSKSFSQRARRTVQAVEEMFT
jgi:hypothetical protein